MSKKHSPKTTVIGIDIGGTGIKGGIVDLETGDVVGERFRIPTPSPSTPQNVAKVVKEIVEELSGREHAPGEIIGNRRLKLSLAGKGFHATCLGGIQGR